VKDEVILPPELARIATARRFNGADQPWSLDGGRPHPSSHSLANDIITEDSAALEFTALYAGLLRYCHDSGSWYEWDGYVWKPNRTGLAFDWARQLARKLSKDEKAKRRYVTSRTGFASGVERYCKADRKFAVTSEVWDQDAFLLGTPGGTVDLRTGKLRPSDQAEGITKLTAVAPTETAHCPRWLQFLNEISGGDQDLVRFLQVLTGYALTGATTEHVLTFVYGGGGNGSLCS
jgi:putative DNA primase/helicase